MMKKYQPFLYPPDYSLARVHHQATKPGKITTKSIKCPCCDNFTKEPLQNWLSRSIEHDFKGYGGAVVTYFWLVKLYAFVSGLVLLVYSSFLLASIHRYCSYEDDCQKFLGIWIVSNDQLFAIMERLQAKQTITRILTLRTITFVILLIGNTMALLLSGRFKRRYPQPKNISSFSLIFRNINISADDFTIKLKQKFSNVQIRQLFKIKKMEPFYKHYNLKLQTYYSSLIQEKQQQKQKLLNKLEFYDRYCSKQQQNYQQDSDRIIVVFESEAQKNIIEEQYELKGLPRILYILGFDHIQTMYCQQCPIPQQIIWNYIGMNERQKIKLKVLSVVYFFALIAGSYLLLFFCMKIVYNRDIIQKPWNLILANIIMILMVPIALTFRQLMNRLSELRMPNTQTSRTMFIVLTTVLFHFIYYIIIPTFYLRFNSKVDENKILFIITNQTFNFLLVQFILAGIDIVYCSWNRRLRKIQDQSKPVGCQKILHTQIQHPRFPIQFKLIILFKTFSFIILFAFESPFIMFMCFGLLMFLYFYDKKAVYQHYRMQIIDNGVQFKFLKIYSTFFSLYTLLIYSITQHFDDLGSQFYGAIILTIVLVFVQLFIIRDRQFEDETILPTTCEQANIKDSYRERYNKFRQNVIDDKTDSQIKQYLAKQGHGSLQTEYSLAKQRLT